jgi:three-Cys-motif partner protein
MKHRDRLQHKELSFLFMDERPDRIENLEMELSKLSIPDNFFIEAIPGQFDVKFRELLDDLERDGLQLAPTFAFIDPFGFKGLPFELVQRLLNNSQTEAFINIMADSINRFLEHPDEQTRQHIVDLFGTPRVLDIAGCGRDRMAELRLLYQEQLEKSARFVRFFEMKNAHDRIIYYLFFATNHPLGHKKMKEAFWKVDTSSGYYFSDATNPNQLVLFEIDESLKLAQELHTRFLNQRVLVETIEKFVDDCTPFIRRHMTRALRSLEQDGKIKVDAVKPDGKKRRKNTYPNDVTIGFVATLF